MVRMADQDGQAEHAGFFLFLSNALVAIVTAPYRRTFKLYTWKPINQIRAAGGDRGILIPLVKDWKADKYAEIQSVQVAASICAGATLATIPWSQDHNPIWVADALWFSSLICSLWAVITSIQAKALLDDLPDRDQLNSTLSDAELQRMRRVILRPGVSHYVMLWIWQFPSMTMSYAWCTFLAGLTVHICTPFIRNMPWDSKHNIAVVYLAVGSVGLITYGLSSVVVYVGEKDYERSASAFTGRRGTVGYGPSAAYAGSSGHAPLGFGRSDLEDAIDGVPFGRSLADYVRDHAAAGSRREERSPLLG